MKKAINVAIAMTISTAITTGCGYLNNINNNIKEVNLENQNGTYQSEQIQTYRTKQIQRQETETYSDAKRLSVTLKGYDVNRNDIILESELEQRKISLNRGQSIKKYNVIVSYYTNSTFDCGKTDNISASGKHMVYGLIAMPKEFKFGTKIHLDSIGEFECQDRGGAIKFINSDTIKVDIYIPNATNQQIRKMGIKKVIGYVVE